jgi:hypothetical protein
MHTEHRPVCVFRMIPRINSDCPPKQQQHVGLRNGDAIRFLSCRYGFLSTYYLYEFPTSDF